MATTFESYQRYREDIAAFRERLSDNGPSWLREIRENGASSFDDLGFPTATRGNERWKYTNVAPIARATFEYPLASLNGIAAKELDTATADTEVWGRLVFVDGHYRGDLSSPRNTDEIRVVNLAAAVPEYGDVVQSSLTDLARTDEDGFTALNTAFIDDGAFVHLPDDSPRPHTLHLVFVSTGRSQATASHPRTLVVAGRNSDLTVVESYLGLNGGQYFTNAVAEIVAHEGARIDHYRYLVESPEAFHIGATRVAVGRDATFNSTSIARGAQLARNDLSVVLGAPGSSTTLRGLYMTAGKQHIDNHIDVDHAEPHTTSDQYFKGILTDRSKAVFSGRVLIREDAQKSNAAQKDLNLLLSEGARVNTKPSMEILADDVKAVHGATAGAVAEDALFYMRSRGVDEQTARALLVYGFASEIIESIRLGAFRQHVEALFTSSLTSAAAGTAVTGG